MVFYTSDLHLGHANVIRHCDRPFSSADEMDAVLIQTGMIESTKTIQYMLWGISCFGQSVRWKNTFQN